MLDNGIASQLICGILTEEMDMPANTVWLRDQNMKIPNDNGLYIIVGLVKSIPRASESYLTTTTTGSPPVEQTNEVNEVLAVEEIQIDILSRSNDAFTRNWEIIAALKSIFSQQQQEINDFKIARLPLQFINTSSAEGGSQLNRYTLTFSCSVWYRKTKVLSTSGGDYYDDFHNRADDEVSIGTDKPILEFEINQEGIVPP